ncbi:hypothetical protein [Pseudoruegeria sp. HB172150]|nr:hypothetical protein [Pseudoruegeria sp. HB172150]
MFIERILLREALGLAPFSTPNRRVGARPTDPPPHQGARHRNANRT